MTDAITPDYRPAATRPRQGALGKLLRRPLALLGLVIIALVLAGAILAPYLTNFRPDEQIFDGLTLSGEPLPPNGTFWLGTDLLGRDLLTRILYGARTSLFIGIVANGIALVIGTLIGVVAAISAAGSAAC